MPCIDPKALRASPAWALLPLLLLAACGSQQPTPRPAAPPGTPSVAPAAPTSPVTPPGPTGGQPASPGPTATGGAASGSVVPPSVGAAPSARRVVPLGPPVAARNWDEFRLQAARRLVQAHPDGTYTGPVPEPLLAIPVLEVELNADGSVRRVHVMRHPKQARDTTQLAIDAIHRAAPYGAMTRLPLPWKWSEVFLFDDDRRFKPRVLDQ